MMTEQGGVRREFGMVVERFAIEAEGMENAGQVSVSLEDAVEQRGGAGTVCKEVRVALDDDDSAGGSKGKRNTVAEAASIGKDEPTSCRSALLG